MRYDKLNHLPVLINLGRGAMTKSQIRTALSEWDELFKYIEYLEDENIAMGERLIEFD